jgi:hypothetical protein
LKEASILTSGLHSGYPGTGEGVLFYLLDKISFFKEEKSDVDFVFSSQEWDVRVGINYYLVLCGES